MNIVLYENAQVFDLIYTNHLDSPTPRSVCTALDRIAYDVP